MEQKTYNIMNDRNKYINNIISDLNDNKNIAIISQSRSECDNFYNLLSNKFENKIIKNYHILNVIEKQYKYFYYYLNH